MLAYPIVKNKSRTGDLSGIGAFINGGRWNSKGTYMLYTSANSSLAYLENLVHFDEFNFPPHIHIVTLEFHVAENLIYELPANEYPAKWKTPDNNANKLIGDKLMANKSLLAVKVRSAVNPSEYNYLLNPLFPGYHDIVTVNNIELIDADSRLGT